MRTFTLITLVATICGCTHFIAAGPAHPLEGDFNTIDESGGYHFGYNAGHIARQELRSPEGVVRGAYTYVDADGQVQIVTYTADQYNGFQVSGTNIPKPEQPLEVYDDGEVVNAAHSPVVEDTPEVAAAKAAHLAIVRKAQLGAVADSVPLVMNVELPLPVQYTPEVAAARSEHFNLRNMELLRSRADSPVVIVIPAPQYHSDYLPYVGL